MNIAIRGDRLERRTAGEATADTLRGFGYDVAVERLVEGHADKASLRIVGQEPDAVVILAHGRAANSERLAADMAAYNTIPTLFVPHPEIPYEPGPDITESRQTPGVTLNISPVGSGTEQGRKIIARTLETMLPEKLPERNVTAEDNGPDTVRLPSAPPVADASTPEPPAIPKAAPIPADLATAPEPQGATSETRLRSAPGHEKPVPLPSFHVIDFSGGTGETLRAALEEKGFKVTGAEKDEKFRTGFNIDGNLLDIELRRLKQQNPDLALAVIADDRLPENDSAQTARHASGLGIPVVYARAKEQPLPTPTQTQLEKSNILVLRDAANTKEGAQRISETIKGKVQEAQQGASRAG